MLAAQLPDPGPVHLWIMILLAPAAFIPAVLGVSRARSCGMRAVSVFLLLLGVLLLGAISWYCETASVRGLTLEEGERRALEVSVRVVDMPRSSGYQGYRWRGEVYDAGDCPAGRSLAGAQIEVYSEVQPRPGDEVHLRGEVFLPWTVRNPGEFDYRRLLLRQGVGYLVRADELTMPVRPSRSLRTGMLRLRQGVNERVLDRISVASGHDVAAVVVALLTGERGHIADDLQDDFRTAGLAHLLAISGLHVMVLAGGARMMLRRGVPPIVADALSVLVVLFYAVFAGGRPSVIRAALLFVAQIGAARMRRESDPLNLLAACGFAMLLQSPRMAFDVGFQLSFGAYWSLVSLRPTVAGALPAPGMPALRNALSVGISIWLVVVPLGLYHFGSASWMGLFVNPLITPLFCLIFLSVQVTAAAAMLGFPVEVLHLFCRPLATFIDGVRVLGEVPGEISAEISAPALLWICFTLLAVGRSSFRSPLSPEPPGPMGVSRLRRGSVVWAAWLSVSLLIFIPMDAPGGVLQVTVFDVGQGDCILVEGPDGGTVMIDTGPPFFYDEGAVIDDAVLPYLRDKGVQKIDHLLLTHGHLDHTGGAAEVLSEFEVGTLWLGPMCDMGAQLHCEPDIAAIVDARDIPVRPAVAGVEVAMEGVEISILWPEDDVPGFFDLNEGSTALRVAYGDWSMLCMGDVEGLGERAMVDLYGESLACTVLKVGHHGSAAGSADSFLRLARPEVAVVSTGSNPYGHPAPETMERLKASGARVLTTRDAGAVILTTDGTQYQVVSMICTGGRAGQEVGQSVGKLETAN